MEQGKNIGIWGFGIVGKSALSFIRNSRFSACVKGGIQKVTVWDNRLLHKHEEEQLVAARASYWSPQSTTLETFFDAHDLIVVSPGIDVRSYPAYESKFIGELDLFAQYFQKPTIAITGTLGKTTIASLLGSLMAGLSPAKSIQPFECKHKKCHVAVAGNIGYGLLSLIDEQRNLDGAILELSSFQLERNKLFAPDIALWTNFYPNHLDRHKNLRDYFDAKCHILSGQSSKQVAITSLQVFMHPWFQERLSDFSAKMHVLALSLLTDHERRTIRKSGVKVFTLHDNALHIDDRNITSLDFLPDNTFQENWGFVLSTLHVLGCDLAIFKKKNCVQQLERQGVSLKIKPHRLELFVTIDAIDFFNDSKATVMQATQAALCKLARRGRPIILMLGGLSKGVDRHVLIEKFVKNPLVKSVVFFGAEYQSVPLQHSYATLGEAAQVVFALARASDQVLFSPGGASFDLFENYQQRGDVFKQLVKGYYAPENRPAT